MFRTRPFHAVSLPSALVFCKVILRIGSGQERRLWLGGSSGSVGAVPEVSRHRCIRFRSCLLLAARLSAIERQVSQLKIR